MQKTVKSFDGLRVSRGFHGTLTLMSIALVPWRVKAYFEILKIGRPRQEGDADGESYTTLSAVSVVLATPSVPCCGADTS